MKTKGDKAEQDAGCNYYTSFSEINNDQEKAVSKNQGSHLTILADNDHHEMGEVIRRWESMRFMS